MPASLKYRLSSLGGFKLWTSRVYFDYSISTDKIGKIELAESSLQIRAQISSRKIGLVTNVNSFRLKKKKKKVGANFGFLFHVMDRLLGSC